MSLLYVRLNICGLFTFPGADVIFEVLVTVLMNAQDWTRTQCKVLGSYRHFEAASCVHLQVSFEINEHSVMSCKFTVFKTCST
jgi:hypothetical protein